ncbi:unannotated protein [freshwater metagenome]|uniref:Unannotated protein n=1 Tax=freshwater metagenome TaxID=449393 RepID=A0A6J6PW39_9ZZZZ
MPRIVVTFRGIVRTFTLVYSFRELLGDLGHQSLGSCQHLTGDRDVTK